MAYHPPQRAIRSTVLTFARWIRATFHLPKLHAFDDHLGKGRPFFTLTDVALGNGAPLPFLALRASAAHVVVPDVAEAELLLSASVRTQPRDVTCLLERVVIRGCLELLPGVRTSDFLVHQDAFLMLRGARINPPLPDRPEPIPVLFVNSRAVIAITEDASCEAGAAERPRPTATPVPHA